MSWILLCVLGAIWGASYLFIKVGVSTISPLTFVAGRTAIAAIALVLFMVARAFIKGLREARIKRESTVLLGVVCLRKEFIPQTRSAWLLLLAMGLFSGVIPYTAITWGETHITSGLAAILTAAVPLFTVIFVHFWTQDEKLTTLKAAGVVLGFVGVVVLFVPELQRGIQIEFWSEFAIIIAAASYGLANLIAHKYLTSFSNVMASTGQLVSAALIMLPLSLVFDNPFALHPSFDSMVALLILALLNTSFAYILYYWLIEHTGATRTALVTYLIPITGILWGALLLSEPITWEAVVGLVLIIAGVGLVNRQSAPHKAMVAPPVEGE